MALKGAPVSTNKTAGLPFNIALTRRWFCDERCSGRASNRGNSSRGALASAKWAAKKIEMTSKPHPGPKESFGLRRQSEATTALFIAAGEACHRSPKDKKRPIHVSRSLAPSLTSFLEKKQGRPVNTGR